MKRICQSIIILFLLCISGYVKSQVIANDDNLVTGPSQKIKYDVTKNDVIPCGNYSLSVVSVTPSLSGTAVFDGDYLVFTPFAGISNQTINVVYEASCPSGGSDQATVSVFVRTTNLPINIIQTDEECISNMPGNVDFGVELKYIAYSDEDRSSSQKGGYLQYFHIPLVGDINGDGKPEIISPGLTASGTLTTYINNIYIYDGQTGQKLFKFDLSSLNVNGLTGYGAFRLGIPPYHQSPSYLAIADVDNDGIGEIIVCQSVNEGKIYCLKPVLNANKKITGLVKAWDGEYGYKAPLSLNYETFGQPIPQIVDVNGDGIPEVIVYNKIYNAQTGKLLMAWNGAASSATASTLAANTGLYEYGSTSLSYTLAKAEAVKARAMVGRRPAGTSGYNDAYLPVSAIIDLEGDGLMEIITGNRIHKFDLTYLGKEGEPGNHTQNTYTTIEGPSSVVIPISASATRTIYLNDGFTRVADIDGDGQLDVIVTANLSDTYPNVNILVYVYDPYTGTLKAASSVYSSGRYGQFGIPFIGDINDRLDGRDDGGAFTKKAPEILFCAGKVYIDRSTSNDGGRSGMAIHSGANLSNARFGANIPADCFHIIGITYDGGESNVVDRLKISWALEEKDQSNNTGITMFDFNNDGAFDLCYRDEEDLRVISPKLGATDYIRQGETELTSDAIIFRTTVYSETGFEAPAIADVNMDGSADIVVTGWENNSLYYANVYVFERESGKPLWAPCPPVWNQALYNPLYINEDLTVPARPMSMLTQYTKTVEGTTETITPYNGAWIQQPIVKEGGEYAPIYRHPDAVLVNMDVEVSGGNTKIKMTVRNDGLASVNATTPVYFYHTVPGSPTKYDETVIPVGVDIFPDEKVDLEYAINGTPAGMFTHCSLVDNGSGVPATGYTDCRPNNNYGYTSVIRAIDDSVTVFGNSSDTEINVIINDTIIGTPIVEIVTGPGEGPRHGTADTLAARIVYTPDAGFLGRDTLRYLLRCEYGGDTLATVDTAFVYILVPEMPDNIDEADCVVEPIAAVWSIRETVLNNNVLIHNYGPLAVGDIDNDGIIEIIGYKDDVRTTNYHESGGIKIFNYNLSTNQIELKREFLFATSGGATSSTFGAIAIARYDDTTHIVVPGTDRYLYAYNVHGELIWRSNAPRRGLGVGAMLGVADFNNDGIPEVYAGNQIFSLTNGVLLCDGGAYSTGMVSVGTSTVAADIDGDGVLELVAGINIYKVTITNNAGTSGNSMSLLPEMQLSATKLPTYAISDGATQVVDIDNDGKLEVVVMSLAGGRCVVYVWKPLSDNQSYIMGSYLVPATNVIDYSIPMLGNIDNTPYPEIVFITNGSLHYMYALKFDPAMAAGSQVALKWNVPHTDGSGCTGATLFDFDQDKKNEIVYRDQTQLRIFDGDGQVLPGALFNNVISGTIREYPVIADIDNDGQAEIIVTGWDGVPRTINGVTTDGQNGYLRIFKTAASPWAPARKVWNQYAYNVVNVNEDLTIPRFSLNPATMLPGEDGVMGTSDDVRPYNSFLQQQTTLSKDGIPIWITPDAYPDQSISNSTVSGNSVSITVGIINQGDAVIGSPVYVTLYKESVAPGNKIETGSANIQINKGDTGYVTVTVADITPYLPMLKVAVKINDAGSSYLYQPECDSLNNELIMLNPAMSLMMKKDATLNSVQDNGTYSNPVSVLHSENIEYRITAVNASDYSGGTVIVRDTLPAYLKYVSNSGNPLGNLLLSSTGGVPNRDVLIWTLSGLNSMATQVVSYEASAEEGVCASQPMFVNRAWITASDTLHIVTGNSTYHQGAGVGVVTFSAGIGGQIYNAEPQAVDFRSSAGQGVLVVPDEGYVFAGWSHGDYLSLRGELINAEQNIMFYDTLTIYGNVELSANFELEKYPIEYYLNGGEGAGENPSFYTVKTGNILLESPQKAGDVFTGWTGSNGDTPQVMVSIAGGSTGKMNFYANYLYSGREDEIPDAIAEDKIWAAEDKLYIRSSKTGSVVRIYSLEGVLQKQQTILSAGEMNLKLRPGIYIVTLNNSTGQKVRIE